MDGCILEIFLTLRWGNSLVERISYNSQKWLWSSSHLIIIDCYHWSRSEVNSLNRNYWGNIISAMNGRPTIYHQGPWWWSACSPSTPTIQVQIPLTPTVFFCKIFVWKERKLTKRGRGWPIWKTVNRHFWHKKTSPKQTFSWYRRRSSSRCFRSSKFFLFSTSSLVLSICSSNVFDKSLTLTWCRLRVRIVSGFSGNGKTWSSRSSSSSASSGWGSSGQSSKIVSHLRHYLRKCW